MPPTSNTWTITGQREDYQPGPTGAIAAGMTITFQTPSGASGTVFVPHADYNVDKVRALVAQRVAVMEQVQKLTGS